MSRTLNILAISGSLRKASHNAGLLRAAANVLPSGMTLVIHDLAALPFYNADLEAGGDPAPVAELKNRMASADGLLIATPEYNYSVPAVLKNAIDWASRPPRTSPLNARPAAIIGAGGGFGTVRAQMHLRQILQHNGVLLLPKPELHVARSSEKFDTDGNLTDERTGASLRALLEAFGAWIERVRG